MRARACRLRPSQAPPSGPTWPPIAGDAGAPSAGRHHRGLMNKLPLSRFKVSDLTRVRAGPTAVRQLADWGAQVIKVEAPGGDSGMGGDRHGPDFQNIHRNKRSITLDLKQKEGIEVLH